MFYIGFKVGDCTEKIFLALFCIVCQYVISTGTISNTTVYQPQLVTSKILIIEKHIKMRDDVWYKSVIDERTSSAIQSIE